MLGWLRLKKNMLAAKVLAPYWHYKHIHNSGECSYACDWVYPYGFVPEAGCPIHDK